MNIVSHFRFMIFFQYNQFKMALYIRFANINKKDLFNQSSSFY